MDLNVLKKHRWELILLFLIFIGGAFLRSYNFTKWLHFEIDQTYDINTVSPAVEKGIADLPLVGTNVGGGSLRLGPSFYYMEYLSALIFGNTPQGHAMQVLILNILAIPLFYVFCRRYFTREVSIGLAAIFSFSLYHIMYSRFSWSPNVLPFLVLLSFYALLRGVSKQEAHPARWFLISVAAIAVTSQIHFDSFFVIPLIAVLFVIIKRPRFPLKVWVAGLTIVLAVYLPLILNDIKTGGQNLQFFQQKFDKTSGSAVKLPQIAEGIKYGAYGSWFVISGDELMNPILKSGTDCNTCAETLYLKIAALLLFFSGISIMFFRIYKNEEGPLKDDFLILNFLWLSVSLYLFYTIAKNYRMYPRFYLIMSPLAIIIFGSVLQYIKPHAGKIRLAVFSLIIVAIIGLNIERIFPIFAQLASVPVSANPNIENGDIFPNTNRLTLEEETKVVDYIEEKYRQNKFPVYLTTRSEYVSAFWYLLGKRDIRYYDGIKNKLYAEGNYFDIKFSDDNQNTDPRFDVLEKKDMGALIIYYMAPKPGNITTERQSDSDRKILGADDELMRFLTWRKLFEP